MFKKLFAKFFAPAAPAAAPVHPAVDVGGTRTAALAATTAAPASTTAAPAALPPKRGGLAVAPISATLRAVLPPGGIAGLDDQLRQTIDAVPPLPQIALKLLRELASPDSSAKSIATLAAQDTSLTTSLLRTANSAAYAPVRAIQSVQDAIAMMGFSAVRAVLFRMKLEAILGKAPSSPEFEELWTHGLAVSQITEVLAPRFACDRANASTLGLLHDLGKLVIYRTRPEAAAKLREKGPSGESYLGREKRVLGATHADIGAHLASRWNLPPELTQGIRFHHAPQLMPDFGDHGASRKAVAVVHLANQMSKYLHLYSEDTEIDIIIPEIWDMLGASGGTENDVESLIEAKVRKAGTDALLMAEAALGKAPSATGRVIRFSPPETLNRAIELAQQAEDQHTPHRIRKIELSGHDLFATALKIDGVQVLHFDRHTKAEDTGPAVEDALTAVAGHLSADARNRTKLAVRWLVGAAQNINPTLAIDVAITKTNGTITATLYADALSFNRRFGTGVGNHLATRILDRECAGVLNLQWFRDLATSHDGASLQLAA